MNPGQTVRCVLLVVAALLPSLPARSLADFISLQPVADTTLIQVAEGANLGGADFFNAGTANNGNRNRALLRYDLSAIPAGSTILGGVLTMDIVRQPVMDLQSSQFSLRRMLVSWGEGAQIPEDPLRPGVGAPAQPGEATWTHRFFDGTAWGLPGGQQGVDYSAQISTTAYVYGMGDAVEFENTPEAAADLQSWLDQPDANFGWMFRTESESARRTARSFASRESSYGPLLIIEFTPVPEPSVLALLALVSATVVAIRRRR